MAVSRTQRFKWWVGRSGKAPKPEYSVGEVSTKGGLYGVKGDPTKGGMYMAEASSSSSSGEGTSPVVADVIASRNQTADFNMTPVQKISNTKGQTTALMKAVNSSPGQFYVSDVKLVQRDEDMPGIFTPVVDVAIAQENVPLSDATPLGANNSPGPRTVWQDVQVVATSLEKASLKNPDVISSGALPDNWQSKGMMQAKAGGAAAVTSAQNTANFSQALESHSKNVPYVIAHLRPGNWTAADGDAINQDYLPPEFKQNLIPGSMAASSPVADIYVVSADALDDRAGNLRYVTSFDYDGEASKPLGSAADDGALLAAYSEGNPREAQKGLAINYNLDEFDNPFGGKVGKFVELKGISADAGSMEKPDIDTLKKANVIDVGFKLSAKDDYKPLPGGFQNFYGKVFAGNAVGEKSKVVIPTMPPKPAEEHERTVAGVMKMGGRPRGDYLRQTEGALKKAATTDEHHTVIRNYGQARSKKKGQGGNQWQKN
jgi:hypothetical protein